MKHCKSALCLFLAAALCLALAGCANTAGTRSNTSSRTTSSRTTSATPSPAATGTPSPNAGSALGNASGTTSGTVSGGAASTGSGSDSSIAADDLSNGAELLQMYDRIKYTYADHYYPNNKLDNDELKDMFGLSDEDYTDFIADTAEATNSRDMLVIIKATEGHEQDVEDKLNAYRESLLADDDTVDREKVEASKVYRNGLYVFYVMLGNVDDDTLSGEGLMEALGKEVDKGLDSLRDFFDNMV